MGRAGQRRRVPQALAVPGLAALTSVTNEPTPTPPHHHAFATRRATGHRRSLLPVDWTDGAPVHQGRPAGWPECPPHRERSQDWAGQDHAAGDARAEWHALPPGIPGGYRLGP